jgi:DNA-binding transcriptional LysR family regulator
LGVTLFERKARPVSTTPAGKLFAVHARAALRELQRGIEAARSTQDQVAGHLVVGSYPSVSSAYLPAVLNLLKVECPGLTVELWEGTASTLEAAVSNGTVDIAFRPTLPKMRDPSLCHRVIWREDIVVVMRTTDPLAQKPSVTVDDILSRPLVGNPAGTAEDGGGFDLRRLLGDEVGRADIAYLTDQPTTLVALVRSVFGIGVINRLALQTASLDGLTVRTVDTAYAYRDVALFWTRRRSDNAAVSAFLRAQQRTAPPLEVQALDEAS